jgi:hypothetical protein
MKKVLLTFCIGALLAIPIKAEWIDLQNNSDTGITLLSSSSGVTTLECNVDGFDVSDVQIGADTWQHIRIPNEPFTLEAGAPELPILAASLIIDDQSATSIVVLEEDHIDLPYKPVPSKGNLTRDIDPDSIPYVFGKSYQGKMWPADQAFLRQPYLMRDYRGQAVVFQPFQYLPTQETLRIYTRLVVEVRENGLSNQNTLQRATPPVVVDRDFSQIYSKRFLNYQTESRYTPLEEQGDMLIICYDSFMDEMEPFVEWKRQSGMNVEIVAKSDIGTSATAIQSYVQDYYITPGLTFLMLIGDSEQIPSLSSDGGASDPSFGMIVGNDAYPDVFVGRFSSGNAAEITSMVERCVEYERDPQAGADWYHKATGIGSDEGSGIGDDGEIDWEHQDNIRADLLGFTFTEVDQIYDPGASSTHVSNAVNAGRSFMNYTGHGSVTAWSTTGFNTGHIGNLTNENMLPLIVDVACVNGQFSGTTCFAEAWMRATHNGEPAGAVGIYASTINQSWAPPMAAQDECTDLLVAGEMKTFGGICINGAMLMNDEYNDFAMTRTWTIFTDPSLQMRTDTPAAISASHTPGMMSTMTSFVVNTAAAGAQGALYADGVLYGKAIADGLGTITILLDVAPPVGTELTLTVTAFNYMTYQGIVSVLPPNGPYVSHDSHSIVDPDGQLNPGDTTGLNISLLNSGVDPATGVQLTLSSTDSYITINDNSATLASIAAGEMVELSAAFNISASGSIPDGHPVSFQLLIEDDMANSWESSFSINGAAAVIEFVGSTVQDGDNSQLDPNEAASLLVSIQNTGSAPASNLSSLLASTNEDISFTLDNAEISSLAAGASTVVEFTIFVSADAAVGDLATFQLLVDALYLNYTTEFSHSIGISQEDFETADFTAWDWQLSGTANWTISTDDPHGGTYCAASGTISHNQESVMELSAYVVSAANLSFWYKVGSEGTYDFLRFYLDGSELLAASGAVGWTEVSYMIPAGQHTFSWAYEKDGSVSTDPDMSWIDDIVFPPFGSAPAPILSADQTELFFNSSMGHNDVAELVLSNTGTGILNYNLQLQLDAIPEIVTNTTSVKKVKNILDRDMTGSAIESAESSFVPGEAMDLNLTLYCVSDDSEWAQTASLEFPVGVEVLSFSNFVGPDDRYIEADGTTGDGALISWLDHNGGYGDIYPGESATCTVSIEVNATFSGDMALDWVINGDDYGSAPHTVNGQFSLINDGPATDPWLFVDLESGSIAAGAEETINVTADALLLAEGTYTGRIIASSNDVTSPLEIEVEFIVGSLEAVTDLQIQIENNLCNSHLTWTAVPGADFYRIYQADYMGAPWVAFAETTDPYWLIPCPVSTVKIFMVKAVKND